MRGVTRLLIVVWVGAACSDDGSGASPTTAIGANATATSVATTLAGLGGDAPHPCQILAAQDFADAGVPIADAGVDLGARIGLATDERGVPVDR